MASAQFLSLSAADRRDALEVAASRSGRRAHLFEKDIWVVQILRALMESPFGNNLTFKGGTSLSKAYHAISRFSEDLDITYDIRAIAADLVEGSGEDALPATRSQEKRWSRQIRDRLNKWVRDQAVPGIDASLTDLGVEASLEAKNDKLLVRYEPLVSGYGFMRPVVVVEFGARSTGEPRQKLTIECDAAQQISEVSFPSVSPFVMLAERTFWEKATAIHVFCRQGTTRWERLSRHWYDLVRLDDVGIAERSLIDRTLATRVAQHKAMFHRVRDTSGNWIAYEAAVSGDLQLVPRGAAYDALAEDYGKMVSEGMLLDDDEDFAVIVERCHEIEMKANRQ